MRGLVMLLPLLSTSGGGSAGTEGAFGRTRGVRAVRGVLHERVAFLCVYV